MKKVKVIAGLVVVLFIVFNFVSCIKNDTRETSGTIAPTACSGTAGPLFTAVKNLMATRCVYCHNSTVTNGGKDFSVECNIVTSSARIKTRAVDEGTMPPTGSLQPSEKAIITNWINAGAKYTN